MDKTDKILECISQIVDLSNRLKKKCYIHGGYVQDIMEGKLLRKHYNIKFFMEKMDDNINYLIKYLKEKKYYVEYWDYTKILHLEKNHIRIMLTSIEFIGYSAIWKYKGENGFINFPKEWLDKEYRKFYNLEVLTSGIYFEYCYGIFFKYLHPFWHKDKIEKYIKALDYFEEKIFKNNINIYNLFKQIWSYTPYNYNDGFFTGYEPPVLVLGKDIVKNHHRTSRLRRKIIESKKNKK